MANLPDYQTALPYISKVHLPDGNDYLIKDAEARDLIEALSHIGFNFIRSTDAATTPAGVEWIDGSTVIQGTLQPSKDIKNIYLVPDTDIPGAGEGVSSYIEYVCVMIGGTVENPTCAWEAIGSTDAKLDNLGNLSKANTATGSTTLSTVNTATYKNGTANVSTKYTPAGGVSVVLSQTGTAATLTKGDYTPAGDIEVTLTQINTPAGITRADYTPDGEVSKPDVDVNAPTGEVYGKKTDGLVTAGTAAEFTEGAFTPATFTKTNDQWVAPVLTTSVSNETLTIGFSQGSFQEAIYAFDGGSKAADTFKANTPTAVTLPTFEKKDFVTGVSAELHEAPEFTGATETGLKVSGVTYDKASVNTQKFTGTLAKDILVTAVNYDKAGVQSTAFNGTEATINSSGTSAGDIEFASSNKTITITVTPDSRGA